MLRALVLLGVFTAWTCGSPQKGERWLLIGDDLAHDRGGWAYQLQQERRGGDLLNVSRPEMTAAFNLNRDRQLNAGEQINNFLRRAYAEMGGLDVVVIALGLNDCRDEFIGRNQERREGFETLLARITTFFAERGQDRPKIIVATPLPLSPEQQAGGGFERAARCIDELAVEIRDAVLAEGFCLTDWHQLPGPATLPHRTSPAELEVAGNQLVVAQLLADCF